MMYPLIYKADYQIFCRSECPLNIFTLHAYSNAYTVASYQPPFLSPASAFMHPSSEVIVLRLSCPLSSEYLSHPLSIPHSSSVAQKRHFFMPTGSGRREQVSLMSPYAQTAR